jgi:hypothetical protein
MQPVQRVFLALSFSFGFGAKLTLFSAQKHAAGLYAPCKAANQALV